MDNSATMPASSGETLSSIASGASAELFDLGGNQVLKLFRDSVSDEMIVREIEASIHAVGSNVPTVAAIARQDRNGRRGIVYPRLDGGTVMDWVRRNPMRAGWALDQMGSIHSAIHRAEGGTLRSVKQVLTTDIAHGPAPLLVQRAAIAYLDMLPDGKMLTHGDFHLGNVMMTPQGMIVIDWSKAAAGHPAADAVRSEMLMRFGIGPSDWVTNLWRDWAAGRLRRAWLAALPGVTARELDQWRPVVALAWLRARDAERTPAFMCYLNKALNRAGLPTLR
ncbi:Possible aminoglycoside phosphotransferase (protein kinase related), diverged [Sphingobium indicum BiD32]|uniref:Possible aminoglycoside phosphotransferase (Protein kinase related), diverged n=1 Tax=Sphingobium indicum BiD32 TaxID=1301087 RepID=N1MSR9_9SPHN|nr:aminoglycoside phosphotransferase family protein [Sphingobium indicum]CCW20215.1 Possible aminoglycoside phosphotransferase (protein kinase related), diverged [Sphingobium indicum BiD32]